jgi:hypothetical protein
MLNTEDMGTGQLFSYFTEYGIGEGRGYTLIHFLSTDIDLSCILTKGGMRILRDAF